MYTFEWTINKLRKIKCINWLKNAHKCFKQSVGSQMTVMTDDVTINSKTRNIDLTYQIVLPIKYNMKEKRLKYATTDNFTHFAYINK